MLLFVNKKLIALFYMLLVCKLFLHGFDSKLDIITFVDSLYTKYSNEIHKNFKEELNDILYTANLNGIDQSEKDQIFKLYFIHKLFTSSDCIDGNNTGIFCIPYFWHWISPNPRHQIFQMPDSLKLSTLSPPLKFKRYKNFADIDRTPDIFFSDFVSENKFYYSSNCGYFKTFGWCSEREMAFNTILRLLGYECKIVAEFGHSWTSLIIKIQNTNFSIKVDNTFDEFIITKINNSDEYENWKKYIGTANQATWYNKTSKSGKMVKEVSSLRISQKIFNYYDNLVKEYFLNE